MDVKQIRIQIEGIDGAQVRKTVEFALQGAAELAPTGLALIGHPELAAIITPLLSMAERALEKYDDAAVIEITPDSVNDLHADDTPLKPPPADSQADGFKGSE